jgi:hypothetical protein
VLRAGRVANFPEPESYAFGPDEYLEHIRRVKSAVKIPGIGAGFVNRTLTSSLDGIARVRSRR